MGLGVSARQDHTTYQDCATPPAMLGDLEGTISSKSLGANVAFVVAGSAGVDLGGAVSDRGPLMRPTAPLVWLSILLLLAGCDFDFDRRCAVGDGGAGCSCSADGETRCASNTVQQCVNGQWQSQSLCGAGRAAWRRGAC